MIVPEFALRKSSRSNTSKDDPNTDVTGSSGRWAGTLAVDLGEESLKR
jgi:hypothetical protein